jgi:hypothetical protein
LRIGEVADLESLAFILALMFFRRPNVQFSTYAAIADKPLLCIGFIVLQ